MGGMGAWGMGGMGAWGMGGGMGHGGGGVRGLKRWAARKGERMCCSNGETEKKPKGIKGDSCSVPFLGPMGIRKVPLCWVAV